MGIVRKARKFYKRMGEVDFDLFNLLINHFRPCICLYFALIFVPVGATDAQWLHITYDDTTLPFVDFESGQNYESSTLAGWGERFNIPGSGGVVDSVDFVMDSIVSDSILVTLYPDTLISTGTGTFYLPNIFSFSEVPFGSVVISTHNFQSGLRQHVAFPHTLVPSAFFLLILSKYGSADKFRASNETPRVVTTENARAVTLGINILTDNEITFPVDGNFTDGTDTLYVDFDYGLTIEAPDGVSASNNGSNSLTIQAYPNPIASRSTISFSLPQASEMTLIITDDEGRETPLLQSTWFNAGQHEFTWDASSYPNGVYLCRLTAGSESVTQRVVVMR